MRRQGARMVDTEGVERGDTYLQLRHPVLTFGLLVRARLTLLAAPLFAGSPPTADGAPIAGKTPVAMAKVVIGCVGTVYGYNHGLSAVLVESELSRALPNQTGSQGRWGEAKEMRCRNANEGNGQDALVWSGSARCFQLVVFVRDRDSD